MPARSPRGLDHVVHAVRDLDAAGELYSRLGFTVGARNRHPWGTHNRIVQMPGFFVELLALAEPDKLGSDGLSEMFGVYNGAFVRRHEGLSLMIVESKDAAADARAFRDAGIGLSPPLRFEREGRRADGTATRVAFTLAFAGDARVPDIRFASCQQHYPENFWNPDLQRHANGVSGIAGAVIVAENPTDHHIFLSAFIGQRELAATSSGITLHTPRGDIQVMDRAAFRSHFATEPPAVDAGPRLAALRFAVADSSKAAAALARAGVNTQVVLARRIVPAQAAMGAILVFENA